jgi:hypothetical protein
MNGQDHKSGFKATWTVVREYWKTQDFGKPVVRLWRSDNRPRAFFRMQLSFFGKAGQHIDGGAAGADTPRLLSQSIIADSGVIITEDPMEEAAPLWRSCRDYMQKLIEEQEASLQASRPRNQGEARPGLKALGKKDRANWESRGRPERLNRRGG